MKGQILKAIREVGLDTPNVECIVAFKIDQACVYEYVRELVRGLRSAPPREPDPRQGWLALPEFAHVPVEVAAYSLEDLRQRITSLDRRIKHYDCARRSPEKLRQDKAQLRELRRVERKVAPLFAGEPAFDVDQAMAAIQKRRESAAVIARIKGGRTGGRGRSKPLFGSTTKNQ